MRFAYADPPYLGFGKKLYGSHHPEAADYDNPRTHQALVQRLHDEFPDGWALSLSPQSLKVILAMCAEDVRVASWCRPNAGMRGGRQPSYAWEPVIFRGGRFRPVSAVCVYDYLCVGRDGNPLLIGAKPIEFAFWVFALLGMEPEDEFHDLFPGSGAVTGAWEAWRSQIRMTDGQRRGPRATRKKWRALQLSLSE